MKKRVIFIAAVVLLLTASVILVLLLYNREPPEISREKYPYAGYSTLSEVDLESSGMIAMREITFEYTLGIANEYVIGEFVTDVDNTKTTTSIIRPKEGTPSELQFINFAELLGLTYEEVLPAWTYYEFLFKITEDFGGVLKAGETIPVKVIIPAIYKGDKPTFPNVKAGTKAVLFMRIDFDCDQYTTDSYSFFYIDEYDRVISCEGFPDFDKYTGTDIKDFKVILQETFENVEHIDRTGSRSDTSVTTEPDTSDEKVSEPVSETDTTAGDSSEGEGGGAE